MYAPYGIVGIGVAYVSSLDCSPPALPEILPPDYRLARMTAAAFHTNAVNT